MFVAGARNLARGRGKGGEIAFQIVGVEAPAVEEAIRPQHQPAAEGADARWHGDRPFALLHRPRQGRSDIDQRPPVDLRLEDLAHDLKGLPVPSDMATAALLPIKPHPLADPCEIFYASVTQHKIRQ